MRAMFQCCYELQYLDLSNFVTINVSDMGYMFNKCNKLKYLNIMNFKVNDITENMFSFDKKEKCEFITSNVDLEEKYYS